MGYIRHDVEYGASDDRREAIGKDSQARMHIVQHMAEEFCRRVSSIFANIFMTGQEVELCRYFPLRHRIVAEKYLRRVSVRFLQEQEQLQRIRYSPDFAPCPG